MKPELSYPIADEILDDYKAVIGNDFDGYRNHVTRMLNFCHYLNTDLSEEDSQKLQVAAAFHDIALWTQDRVDYIYPSIEDCKSYIAETEYNKWADEICAIVEMHHLVHSYDGGFQRLVELFRKADLVDFSLGLIKFGLPSSIVKDVKRALPNAGFHLALVRFTGKQLTRNPLKPLPMMKFRNNRKPAL
jgi:hypothetical protein